MSMKEDASEAWESCWAQQDTKMKATLIKYLRLSSCDGRPEREQLRKELCETLGYKYSIETDSLIERS